MISVAKKFRAAFTLVELLTVIAILAVVAGIGLPALIGILSGNGQTQAAGQVSAAVQRARSLAIQLNTPVALVFFEEYGYTGQTGMAYEVATPGSVIYGAVFLTFNLYPSIATQFLPNGTYVAAFSGSNGPNTSGGSVTAGLPPSYPPFLFPNTVGLSGTQSLSTYSNVYGAIIFDAQGQIANIGPNVMKFQSPDSSATGTTLASFPSASAICVFQPSTFSSTVLPAWPPSSSVSASDSAATLTALAAQLTTYQDLVVFNPFTGNVIK